MTTSDEMITAKEVCSILKISAPTLERWIRKGILAPMMKIGKVRRWSRAQVDAAAGMQTSCGI